MIPSITSGPRQSNFELLRIVAMFLVLVVHADFWALGGPDANTFTQQPLNAFTRTMFESISIICVNVFILISGWFGIKPSFKGFFNFVFQCTFFLIGIYALMIAAGRADISFHGIAGCLCLTPANWFIRAYVGLYIISPLINAFLEKASKRRLELFLIAFFIFQSVWGWLGAAKFVEQGYSTFSFVGLYVLARYSRLHLVNSVKRWGGGIYVLCVVLISLTYWLVVKVGIGRIDVYAYVNPLVVLSSLGLLLWFSQLNIESSKFINWVAKSSFGVFLIHSNPNIGEPVFKVFACRIYDRFDGMECILALFTFLCVVYIVGTVFDQPRKWLWNYISKWIYTKSD